jgi:hypothetical protein
MVKMSQRTKKPPIIIVKAIVALIIISIIIYWRFSKQDSISFPFFTKTNNFIGTWEGVNRPSNGQAEGIDLTLNKDHTGIWHSFEPDFSMDHYRFNFSWAIKGSNLTITFDKNVQPEKRVMTNYFKFVDKNTLFLNDSPNSENPLIMERVVFWKDNPKPKKFIGSWKTIDSSPDGEIGLATLNENGTGIQTNWGSEGSEKEQSHNFEWGITQNNQFVFADEGEELRFSFHFNDKETQFEIVRPKNNGNEESLTFIKATREEVIREVKTSHRLKVVPQLYLSYYDVNTGAQNIKAGRPPITEIPAGKRFIFSIDISGIDPSKSHNLQTQSFSTSEGNFNPKPNEWAMWGSVYYTEKIGPGRLDYHNDIIPMVIGLAGWWTGKKKVEIYFDGKLVDTFYFNTVPRTD